VLGILIPPHLLEGSLSLNGSETATNGLIGYCGKDFSSSREKMSELDMLKQARLRLKPDSTRWIVSWERLSCWAHMKKKRVHRKWPALKRKACSSQRPKKSGEHANHHHARPK
jgi:hypothetical protein